jgi:hypothetical protein
MSIELHIHIVAYACSHLPSEHQPTIKRSWFVTHALDEASTDLEFKLDNDIKAVLSGINDLVPKDQHHLAINSVLFSAATLQRRDGKPNLPYDDKTTKDCTYWIDYDGSQECMVMLEEDWVTLEQFIRWVCCFSLHMTAVELTCPESQHWARVLKFDGREVVLC